MFPGIIGVLILESVYKILKVISMAQSWVELALLQQKVWYKLLTKSFCNSLGLINTVSVP